MSWPTRLSSSNTFIHPCRCHIFHLYVAMLKDLFCLPWKFCIVRKLHAILYPFEEIWYWKSGIVILSELRFFLIFDWFSDINIPDHEILHQFMAQYTRKLFLLVIPPPLEIQAKPPRQFSSWLHVGNFCGWQTRIGRARWYLWYFRV